MQALEELPDRDKDLLLPFFQLCPWTTAYSLESGLSRLTTAFSNRACFVSLAEAELCQGDRPVHKELSELRVPTSGYAAWCSFIEDHTNFIPALQIDDLSELSRQADRLYSLNRGLLVPFERRAFVGVDPISRQISEVTRGGTDVCFLLDFGRANRDILLLQGYSLAYIEKILENAPSAFVSISASSFPESFTAINEQEIFERSLYNLLYPRFGQRLIYSDRGSARAERQSGGGGAPAPRIDYAEKNRWSFFRSDDPDEDRFQAYFTQARLAKSSAGWDSKLRIWGTQMIERTALGDRSAIVSPKRSTAARINIHLHRQLFYSDPSRMYDTDDDWTD
jgi:hypothetical protein